MVDTKLPLVFLIALGFSATAAEAQCPTLGPLQNFGAGSQPCPCFIVGEQAGVVLDLPPSAFPIEILRIQVEWKSQFGGQPDLIEQALHVYTGKLPNPGNPIFTLPGPTLRDIGLNDFDIEPLPGQVIVNQGPFTVTLEFQNQNAGQTFSPSVVTDQDGCQPGKSVVFAVPGGWIDGCAVGLPGDIEMAVVYRQLNCPSVYCTAKATSCGSTPAIAYTGFSSAGASSGFTIDASAARSNKLGLLIYTDQGPRVPAAPFGQSGLLCINSPVRRAPIVGSIGGTPGQCDAGFSVDMNAFNAGALGGNPQAYLAVPGTLVDCQWWGRDTFAHGAFLTDALQFQVLP